MEKIELIHKMSLLINAYFTSQTKIISRKSNSICIRKALQYRVGEYFTKSFLNEMLISKGFKFLILRDSNYCFNISMRDISILFQSKLVLDEIKQKTNYFFGDYIKIPEYEDANYFKYTFKYWIKIKLQTDCSEEMVYNILAKETHVSPRVLKKNIEILNTHDSPEMMSDLYSKLISIFDISEEDSFTNQNLNCKIRYLTVK